MPKLGLTMIEGTIAHWKAAPGSRFQTGDVIVVVETDKIAYDVEAPGPGILQQVLAAEGSVVPVGAPIGRWDVGDIKVDAPVPETTPQQTPVSAVAQPNSLPAASAPRRETTRTLATPFARRLARNAGIDLSRINGSGPRGRIKAADVNRAIETGQRSQVAPAAVAASAAAEPAASFAAGVEVDVTDLLTLNTQINAELPQLHADLVHYVILAAAKTPGIFSATAMFGLAPEDESGAIRLLASDRCTTLRSIIALAATAAQAAPDSGHGALWIEPALGGISFVSAAPPSGWSAALAIGTARDTFRADSDGAPKRAAMINIVLNGRAGEINPAAGQRFLQHIRTLLESPLFLLAS